MDTTRSTPDATLYDDDFYSWTQQQAEHIRQGRMSCLDLENIAEEIESLGKSQLSALTSSYRLIAIHLLKMMVQTEKKRRRAGQARSTANAATSNYCSTTIQV